MTGTVDPAALDQLFRSARSLHHFTSQPVTDETLHAVYDIAKWGPTAFNGQPARYVFIRSAAAKARLAPALAPANQEKTAAAPVTVVIAYDTRFYEHLPDLAPGANVGMYLGNVALAESTAFRNSSLQGAYLLLAARALGLTVGPMSGFNAEAVNREFFPDGRYRANFLANLGYADDGAPRPRGPRFEFAAVAQVL